MNPEPSGASGGPAFAVPGHRDGVCWICAGRSGAGYSRCTSCRDVALGLGRALVPVTPVALVDGRSGLYRALRQYKSGEPAVARRQAGHLAALLAEWWGQHVGCVAPSGVDAGVVVPSSGGRRPPHPLEGVVASAGLAPIGRPLERAPAHLGRRQPDVSAYRLVERVRGLRILLVDDVYTTGAHLQSAAAALSDAGASVVPVALGRYVGTGAEEDVLQRAPWDAGTCPGCRHPHEGRPAA